MDRTDWLREQRRTTEDQYSTVWAPRFGVTAGLTISKTHRAFMLKFLDLLPQPCAILDAACGAGKYVPMLLERGHKVLGIDQAQGMLARAKALHQALQVETVGLQEMAYEEAFDGAICMDAMEHIAPEDWPPILGNFHRALKPHGYLYFTVELADPDDVQAAFDRARAAGLPAVYGEWPDEVVYHYYPSMPQVKVWLDDAGFDLVDEGEGDGYCHLIARRSRPFINVTQVQAE
jgi:SAM-dependent methyltransferase